MILSRLRKMRNFLRWIKVVYAWKAKCWSKMFRVLNTITILLTLACVGNDTLEITRKASTSDKETHSHPEEDSNAEEIAVPTSNNPEIVENALVKTHDYSEDALMLDGENYYYGIDVDIDTDMDILL